jgi:2-haloacid dehalogenase
MIKLVVFDAYGTLFNVYSIRSLLESLYPTQGVALSIIWRDKQVQYTHLIAMSDPNPAGSQYFLSFWEITLRSLRYSCKKMGLLLTTANATKIMHAYTELSAFEESLDVLQQVKAQVISTAILSNGTSEMISSLVNSNGLQPYLDQVLSVEALRTFKTAPQCYALVQQSFPVKKEEILFVSSNAWDAVGASWFGFNVLWVNRFADPFEEIGNRPAYEGQSLHQVLEII